MHTIIPAGEISLPLSDENVRRIKEDENNQVVIQTDDSEEKQLALLNAIRTEFPEAHNRARYFKDIREVRVSKIPEHRKYEIRLPNSVSHLAHLFEVSRGFMSHFGSQFSTAFIQEEHWHQYADRFNSGNGQLGLSAELLIQVTVRLFAERLQMIQGVKAHLCSEQYEQDAEGISKVLKEGFECYMNGYNAEINREEEPAKRKSANEFDAVLRVSSNSDDPLYIFYDATTSGTGTILAEKSDMVVKFIQKLVIEEMQNRVGAFILSHRKRNPGQIASSRLYTISVSPLTVVENIADATKATLDGNGEFSTFQNNLDKLMQDSLPSKR